MKIISTRVLSLRARAQAFVFRDARRPGGLGAQTPSPFLFPGPDASSFPGMAGGCSSRTGMPGLRKQLGQPAHAGAPGADNMNLPGRTEISHGFVGVVGRVPWQQDAATRAEITVKGGELVAA